MQAGSDADVRDRDGNVISDPSGDEFSPTVSDATLLGNASLPALEPAWNTFGNPSTKKGEARGAPSGAPGPKLLKTKEAAGSERDDLSRTRRRTVGLPEGQVVVTVSNGHLLRAGREPARGWPAYTTLYLMGDPTLVVRDRIFAAGNYKDMEPKYGWITGDPTMPLSKALAVCWGGTCRRQ